MFIEDIDECMYITTSRKPSELTRRVAKNIAHLIGLYENRGKKSVKEVVSRADDLGYSRIMVISEAKGGPSSLTFISNENEWEWLDPEVLIKVHGEVPVIGRTSRKPVYIGPEKYSHLFDFQDPGTDDVVEVEMSDKQIIFRYRGQELMLDIRGFMVSDIESIRKDEKPGKEE